MIANGVVTIEEVPEIDLAVVRPFPTIEPVAVGLAVR